MRANSPSLLRLGGLFCYCAMEYANLQLLMLKWVGYKLVC